MKQNKFVYKQFCIYVIYLIEGVVLFFFLYIVCLLCCFFNIVVYYEMGYILFKQVFMVKL